MALYQYFFVSKANARLSPWDAVVGTFSGKIEGGGESAAMAIMLLIANLTAIALWRQGYLKKRWAILIIITGLGTMALAEVKAVVMLLPIVIGLYYRKELLRKPIESIVVMIGAVLLVGGILTAYQQIHYSVNQRNINSKVQLDSIYERIMEAINPEAESSGGRQIGRVNQLITWWDTTVSRGDLQHSLLGYGMGATHSSKVGAGEIASRFYHQVNNTTSVILLWESGLVGHVLFVLILLFAARTSESMSRNENIPEIHCIFLRIGSIGLLLLAITLPYKNFHLYSHPIQFLMMMMLGQAAYWSRYVKKLHDTAIK
jgi:ABC-type multidrug transport system fused ATPase/permease subunit